MQNPYSLLFGQEPSEVIARVYEKNTLLDAFCRAVNPQNIYLITGIRGAGKTVLMTEVSRKIESMKDWIVIELNPERDMLQSLAAKLAGERELAELFRAAKINLSFFGFGIEISGVPPLTDIEAALIKMLESLKKAGKKVLVTVDEVTNRAPMRVFAGSFQIFIRRKLPVFLLMTGLYENIHKLQNEDSLTFLYRAPRITLNSLNLRLIAENYEHNLDVSPQQGKQMALLTKGYSFAFQVLGYFTWEYSGNFENALPEYRQYLEDYVYEKIWAELSKKDKELVYAIACSADGKAKSIRDHLQIRNNELSPYRKRLLNKGLLSADTYGYLTFTLPLFDSFVLSVYDEYSV